MTRLCLLIKIEITCAQTDTLESISNEVINNNENNNNKQKEEGKRESLIWWYWCGGNKKQKEKIRTEWTPLEGNPVEVVSHHSPS